MSVGDRTLAAEAYPHYEPIDTPELEVRKPLATEWLDGHCGDMTTKRSYRFHPISTADAEALRQRGGPVYVADEKPAYPCRQCLHDAEVGDELILVSHDPFMVSSPYRCASPIFLHRFSCAPSAGWDHQPAPPDQLTCRQLSVRSFDAAGMMIDAAVIDGPQLDDTAHRLFEDPQSVALHVHNVPRGCWATTLVRT